MVIRVGLWELGSGGWWGGGVMMNFELRRIQDERVKRCCGVAVKKAEVDAQLHIYICSQRRGFHRFGD